MTPIPDWLPRSPAHLVARERKSALLAYLHSTCMRVVQCDVTGCDSRQDALLALAKALGFPASFQGRNLDAFFDLFWDVVAPNEAFSLVVEGTTAFAHAHPAAAQALSDGLAELSEGSALPRVYWVE